MGKTLESKFFNILSSLNSFWAKIAIIGIFVCTGFKFGCYYKETQMKLEQLEGIVLMHVQANLMIKPSDNIMTCVVIPWFTNFTLLFMIISAFSMCCGYYERVKSGAITPAKFYAKRYHRTWPFFAMMVIF